MAGSNAGSFRRCLAGRHGRDGFTDWSSANGKELLAKRATDWLAGSVVGHLERLAAVGTTGYLRHGSILAELIVSAGKKGKAKGNLI